jgi:hypothetical protein
MRAAPPAARAPAPTYLDDLLRDNDRVDEVAVEPVAELVDARGDLVEADALLLAIAFDDEHGERYEDTRLINLTSHRLENITKM